MIKLGIQVYFLASIIPDKNSNEELIEDVIICAYNRNLEKNKNLDRVKVNKGTINKLIWKHKVF